MSTNSVPKVPAPLFAITASRDSLHVEIHEDFWDHADTFIDQHGTTRLDAHVQQLSQEINTALYYVANAGWPRH